MCCGGCNYYAVQPTELFPIDMFLYTCTTIDLSGKVTLISDAVEWKGDTNQ